jgi:hypothetical protein
MKLKDLQVGSELDITQLMEIKGGYTRSVIDCGGNLCDNSGCVTNATKSCDTKACGGTTCTNSQCDSYAK